MIHVSLHGVVTSGADTAAPADNQVEVGEGTVALRAGPLPVSFEQAYERLDELPRMFVEPDGSFVWAGIDQRGDWQIEGVLYDAGGRLQHVEIKGMAPRRYWEQLFSCFDWPRQELCIQWVREARYIPASDFLEQLS